MTTYFTDRGRIEAAQRCPRARFHQYHDGPAGVGIVPARKSLPLAVGGAVHVGLAHLLSYSEPHYFDRGEVIRKVEDDAVSAALLELEKSKPGGLALDSGEEAAQREQVQTLGDQLAGTALELGVAEDDPHVQALVTEGQRGAQEFERYLWLEQSALVEGLVRAWAKRRLRPLLERYEVLEVEREGTWILWDGRDTDTHRIVNYTLEFMSRPDALLLERETQTLWLQSFKTAASWDLRKERDAQRDMQGISEGVEVERRLCDWWQQVQATEALGENKHLAKTDDIPLPTWTYLKGLAAPPRIQGIRYEYLLKGSRWEDKSLSARVGFSAWTQRSHLVRQYVARSVPQSKKGPAPFAHGDVCWSWDYLREDGSESKLAWQNWESQPVWEQPGGVKAWIDKLDSSQEAMSAYDPTLGMEPRPIGWKSDAQALGFTKAHPFDTVFHPVIEVYRQEDEVRDWLEQVEQSEHQVAEGVERIREAKDEEERRSLLNLLFPQSRRACEYPTTCPYVPLCWGGEDIRRDPTGVGKFVAREPHHQPERDSLFVSYSIGVDKAKEDREQ